MAEKLSNTERQFYELCYDQYKYESEQTENIYQRSGFMVASLPILGAATYALGRVDLLRFMFTRVDYFLHALFTGFAWLAIATSVIYLVPFPVEDLRSVSRCF